MAAPLFIGISLGDVAGIGPEVTLKALSTELARDDARYLLIGDAAHLKTLNQKLGLDLQLPQSVHGSGSRLAESDRLVFCDTKTSVPPNLPSGSPEAARASYEWVKEGACRCLDGELDALVTAPVNKEAIVRAGIAFVGQTELLSEMAGGQPTAMMLLGTDDRGRWLRVALATTHVPLRDVADHLSVEGIASTIELSARACRDLGLSRARIGVCGLNPHAGEGGKIGTEELTLIAPAVKLARSKQVEAIGPLSADALFYYAFKGEYDAVVAMYHDQGLAPLKMVAFEQGVNWTVGLPFVRTSPDHGTAYDIAGRGIASPSSMIAAIQLAKRLAAARA